MADEAFDWTSLEDHVDSSGQFNPPAKKSAGIDAKVVKFPCTNCSGTGKYRGIRINQPRSDCFACKGRGYFMTSERERADNRHAYRCDKAKKLSESRAAFDSQYPEIAGLLEDQVQWSDFSRELQSKLAQYGYLTDGQVAAIRRTAARAAASRDARQQERTAGSAEIDLTPIRTMFEAAVMSGHKRPIYRAAGLEISRAPDHGRNPGALYVVDGETSDYLGKILGTQYTGKPAAGLAAIALDPRGEAIRYGQRTGTCSCCGRLLTAEASIEAGIGPICASKWGL